MPTLIVDDTNVNALGSRGCGCSPPPPPVSHPTPPFQPPYGQSFSIRPPMPARWDSPVRMRRGPPLRRFMYPYVYL
ncbi:hypothetical protein GALMADRAFT_228020 [Galerina marginata CBS 339.88]|uniref:Uncharacterized protein n=1 Tax=Galerina marginata (strain CBS 339.88) TaxID=685588 RepID=A0A067SRS3_GALM3|nr:hypothetical protein GALMADRAFT_228020 [Galerina marginata CBS 339.88]